VVQVETIKPLRAGRRGSAAARADRTLLTTLLLGVACLAGCSGTTQQSKPLTSSPASAPSNSSAAADIKRVADPGAGTAKHGYPASSARTELIFGSGDDDHVYVNDVGSRTTRSVTLPQWYADSLYRKWQSIPLFGPVVPVGNRLVYMVGPKQEPAKGVLLSVGAGLNEPPLRLVDDKVEYHDGVGPYFAANGIGRIWIDQRTSRSTYRVAEVNVETGATEAVTPPLGRGAYPVAAMSNGLRTARADLRSPRGSDHA
jgi:hypothetical protein